MVTHSNNSPYLSVFDHVWGWRLKCRKSVGMNLSWSTQNLWILVCFTVSYKKRCKTLPHRLSVEIPFALVAFLGSWQLLLLIIPKAEYLDHLNYYCFSLLILTRKTPSPQMVKHTQTIRRPLSVFDHFEELAFIGLSESQVLLRSL